MLMYLNDKLGYTIEDVYCTDYVIAYNSSKCALLISVGTTHETLICNDSWFSNYLYIMIMMYLLSNLMRYVVEARYI